MDHQSVPLRSKDLFLPPSVDQSLNSVIQPFDPEIVHFLKHQALYGKIIIISFQHCVILVIHSDDNANRFRIKAKRGFYFLMVLISYTCYGMNSWIF